jgi:dihydroorotate dehydrogenase (fumarate)
MSIELTSTYLGMRLASPLVASAGPLTGDLDSLRRLEDAGAAAVVLPSLFEEDIVDSARQTNLAYEPPDGISADADSYLPELPVQTVVERHLQLVADARAALSIPVIASLNGVTPGGWVGCASQLVDAGADAIELNMYFVPADADSTGAEVEARYVDMVRRVRAAVAAPLALKLSPFFSATANAATAFANAGVDGLVCFNRFYQPDIDLETLDVTPTLSLSTSAELRLPLRWIAILTGQVDCSLALSTGVHIDTDVVKAILAGADAVMTTSALLERGPAYIGELRDGLARWLDEHEYESVTQARGSVSRRSAADPEAYERANYVEIIRRHMRAFTGARGG